MSSAISKNQSAKPLVLMIVGLLGVAFVLVTLFFLEGIQLPVSSTRFTMQELSLVPTDMFMSQAGQDQYVLFEFFQNNTFVNTGVFLEFGARDGEEHSNTYFFAKKLGWIGILAEPVSKERNNVEYNRPESAIIKGGFCQEEGSVRFLQTDLGGLGGVLSTYDEERLKFSGHIAQITCFRLVDILGVFGIRHVNYMSVDIEGSELPALRSFPFDNVTVDVIGVEVLKGNKLRQQKADQLVRFLDSVGYQFYQEYEFDWDTSDYFFIPKQGLHERPQRAFYDEKKFKQAQKQCKLFQRCV